TFIANSNQFYQVTGIWSVGEFNPGVTPSSVNSNLTINQPGEYRVVCSVSMAALASNFRLVFFQNGIEIPTSEAIITGAGVGSYRNITVQAVVSFSSGDTCDLRISSSNSSQTVTFFDSGFNVYLIGGAGPTGYTGPGNFTGYTGYTGYTGVPGSATATGATGYTGYTGYTGPGGQASFGELYINNGSTPLALTNQNQFYQITGFVAEDHNAGVTPVGGATSTHTINIAGYYEILVSLSATATSLNTYQFQVFNNGIGIADIVMDQGFDTTST